MASIYCFIHFYYNIRRPTSEVYDEPPVTRYALDEKFLQELEAEEITKPELKLKSYNWNADQDEVVNFRKKNQDQSQYVVFLLCYSICCII